MNNILRNTLLWMGILFLFFNGYTYAQDPFFNHYSEDEELPTNEVYGITMDDDNIIYIATDKGLVVYDGYTFKTLTVQDTLGDNCILRMHNDKVNKRIWLTSLKNTCDYIENGEIHEADFNDSLMAKVAHEHFVQDIFVTSDGQIFLTVNDEGLFKIENQELIPYTKHLDDAGDANICIFKVANGYYWDLIKVPEFPSTRKSTSFVRDNKIYLKTDQTEDQPDHRKGLVVLGENEFVFYYFNRLYHFRNDSLVEEKTLQYEIFSLYYDKQKKQIWVGTDGDGVLLFRNKSIYSDPQKLLKDKSISGILIDHERNYWFLAKDEGIFRANNLEFPTFNLNPVKPDENRILSMDVLQDHLYLGTLSGKLFRIDSNEVIEEVKDHSPDGVIRRLMHTDHSSILIFANNLYEIDSSGKRTGLDSLPTYPYAYQELDSTTALMSITSGISRYENNKEILRYEGKKGFMKIRQMFKASDDRIFMSSQPYGVYTWYPGEEKKPKEFKELRKLREKRVTSYQEFRGNIVLSPVGYGIVFPTKDSLFEINTQKTLSSNMVDQIVVENDSTIWAATNKGLNRIVFPTDSLNNYDITIYDTKTGMPSNRIYSICFYKGDLWAATGKGLVKIPADSGSKNDLTKPLFEEVFTNDLLQETILSNNDSIRIEKRYPFSLKVNFKTISYHEPHKIYYHYKLSRINKEDNKEDSKWAFTQDLEVKYSNMEHGEYQLCVFASRSPVMKEIMRDDADKHSHLKITIPPRFEHTPFHTIIVIIFSLAALVFIILMVVKEIKSRERNKQRLLMAEKTALLSQMNPHFIFNSLNSIQHYIIEQDADNANLYLAKFSQLIRKTLDNSKKKRILLKEEIETITLYLNLEKLRFEENFDFEIKTSKTLDQYNTVIPPMLLQPFVENAIWHGIMPLKSKGHVKMSFERNRLNMIVRIEDNGVGREKSLQKKRIHGHTPTGVKNVTERIALINKTISDPIKLTITDLKDSRGIASGTLVELIVPINDDE